MSASSPGAARYTSDKVPQNAARAFVLRSPHAHARFRITDVSAARAMPGVLLILTAEDIAHLGGLPCLAPVANADGSPMQPVPYPILAKDVVRHVGDAVAFMVAETLAQARDAAEAIGVDYENLPAVNGIVAALKPGAPLVWPERQGNIVFDAEMGSKEKAEAGFVNAHHVTKLRIVNNRLVSNYMETRAVVASYNPRSERFHLNLGSQGVHGIRDVLADAVFKVPKEKVHVTTGDVGGGFGTKAFCYREYPLAAEAAKRLGRPVAWIGERGEHFLGDAQGRDHITEAELALDAKGRILGLKIDVLSDMGAYLSAFAPFIPSLAGLMAPWPLRHSGHLLPLPRTLHEHASRRRLSRRRAAGGSLSYRAPRRSCRARVGHRARQDQGAQLHQAETDALQDGDGARLRFQASSRAISTAPWRLPAGRLSRSGCANRRSAA